MDICAVVELLARRDPPRERARAPARLPPELAGAAADAPAPRQALHRDHQRWQEPLQSWHRFRKPA